MITRVEIRPYTDGQLHAYRAGDLAAGADPVAPVCVEETPWSRLPVLHVRGLVGGPLRAWQQWELHPACGVWMRKHKRGIEVVPEPPWLRPVVRERRGQRARSATAGSIRGRLP